MQLSLKLDKFGIILSAVCMVHCLAAPVLMTLIPIFSTAVFLNDALFHQLMLWFVLPTSVIALFLGCSKHKRWSIVLTGAAGILILLGVAFWGHDLFGQTGEKIATTAGGIILAISHFLNYRACQSITCESKNCSTDHHH